MTMLDRMRRHKGWLKWSLGLVVLTFVAFYATDFVRGSNTIAVGAASPSDVVASVEGQKLTAGDFQRRYLAQVQAYQTAYGDKIDEQMLRRLGIDSQILQQMVDEQATLFEAQRQGIKVSAPLHQPGLKRKHIIGLLAHLVLSPRHAVQPTPGQRSHQAHQADGHQQFDQSKARHWPATHQYRPTTVDRLRIGVSPSSTRASTRLKLLLGVGRTTSLTR